MKLVATHFQVLNYCNIDDSGWIPLEAVTALIGRNESGKTALLRALHKFNPATEDPYDARREFPRDRFATEFDTKDDWPVCRVEFKLSDQFHKEITDHLGTQNVPNNVRLTRHYSGRLAFDYGQDFSDDPISTDDLLNALDTFAKGARQISYPRSEDEGHTQEFISNLVKWANLKKRSAQRLQNLRTEKGLKLLRKIRSESDAYAESISAQLIEHLQNSIDDLLATAETASTTNYLDEVITSELPVFIYFDNYGILDSSIYLPRFLDDLQSDADSPSIRTINAIFKYANITAQKISDLGREEAEEAKSEGRRVTSRMNQNDEKNKQLRSMILNSASIEISDKFNRWYHQGRHTIKYQADGSYFRIWISDDRLPGVEIELEYRSKGFQWFFSFYVVFLVESEDGHKDAILLLDEPGLHLHPTAQRELIAFFDTLSQKNPLIYTTHSPFLVDGERIQRIRSVTEDESRHCRVSVGHWPRDQETIFPLYAAAGYAMIRDLFLHSRILLVEGMTDYLYLHALNSACRETDRPALPLDIYLVPCGGTKNVSIIVSLFLARDIRPVVLLDGDESGRARRTSLVSKQYVGNEKAILMLSEVFDQDGYEIEDMVGKRTILRGLQGVLGRDFKLDKEDGDKDSLVTQIKCSSGRQGIELPSDWKALVALKVVSNWSHFNTTKDLDEVLDRAEQLFGMLVERFQ